MVSRLKATSNDDLEMVMRAIDCMEVRGSLLQAAEIVSIAGEGPVLAFLKRSGSDCLRLGGSAQLANLINSVQLSKMMHCAELMLLWSDVLLDTDELSEALSKAKAARVIAEHEADYTTVAYATANALDVMRLSNRWVEAEDLLRYAEDLLPLVPGISVRSALYLASAPLLVLAGRYEEAEAMLTAACGMEPDERPREEAKVWQARALLALIPCFSRGDFRETAKRLSPLTSSSIGGLSQRNNIRGNMGTALVELGRIDRGRAVLQEVVDVSGPAGLIQFLPSLGSAQFCDGQERQGLVIFKEGIQRAHEMGAESEVAQNRVYESMLLRAFGRLDEALSSAERAYDFLCNRDYLDFRRLAALEVAASLLALGDPSAARAWTDPVVAAGFGENDHHRFRAAMILAECDRLDGQADAAVARIRESADHVRSENSNFQAAIYCRAFPGLLGVIAAAMGSSEIPIHLLRMIPAEVGERALKESNDLLTQGEWETLGRRLLGSEQFEAFVERKGRPICRVKLFGGLEVMVGERSVREKDWRKRKARMLFAMLALERGRQLSREQILEHVWPDMPEDRAKNNFYVVWSTMKSALMGGASGPCLYVENTGGLCSIVRDAVRSDVDEFEECLVTARQAEAKGDAKIGIEAYQRMATVYRGELLPGDLYDDWFAPIRDRYRLDFVASMLRVVDLLLERDDPCEAAVYARRAIEVDPFREDLYQALLKCQIAAGQRSAAIETFVACKTQIAEELGLDPAPETVALYQQILCMEERPRYDDFGLTSSE